MVVCFQVKKRCCHLDRPQDVGLRLSVIRLVFSVCQRYGVKATWPLFVGDGIHVEDTRDGATGSGKSADVGRSKTVEQSRSLGLIPSLVMFVRVEHEDWERRKYSQVIWIRFFRVGGCRRGSECNARVVWVKASNVMSLFCPPPPLLWSMQLLARKVIN